MYKTLRYNSKERWLSYWYQISETVSRKPARLLIIGTGSGIVEKTISGLAPDVKITTCDISGELSPSVVGDVRHLPFRPRSFDCILCCQVLEHIPFEDVRGAVKDLHRTVADAVILSLPHKRKHIKVEIDTPVTGKKMVILKYPFVRKNPKEVPHVRGHFWDINRGVSYRRVRQVLTEFFRIDKTYLNEMNCTHRFFVMNKRDKQTPKVRI